MNKIKTRCYQCKKCNKLVYYQTNTEYETICKVCKNEMQLLWEHDYKPNNGLKAIKNNSKSKFNTEFHKNAKPVVECPYCHSANTKKISGFSKAGSMALFGIFALGKTSKQWHCNHCGSDFQAIIDTYFQMFYMCIYIKIVVE